MEKNELRKYVLEMMVLQSRIKEALERLKHETISLEFDEALNMSETYLSQYSICFELIYDNAIEAIEELNDVLTTAIEDHNNKIKSA